LNKKNNIICLLLALFLGTISSAQVLSKEALDSMVVFRNLDDALASPDRVFRLDLSKQKLIEFPEEILQLVNLNELILDKTRINAIPNEISRLTFLQTLSLQHNEIDTIPTGLLKLKNLTKLDLADNLIGSVPENIDKLQSLEILSLWDNPIASYPSTLSDLQHLKYLDLLHNPISGETQERLRNILPDCKVIMSPPCSCLDGGE
jgi:Leucine-rich repeat (LRR) protein